MSLPHGAVCWLQSVIVAFPCHTYLLLNSFLLFWLKHSGLEVKKTGVQNKTQ